MSTNLTVAQPHFGSQISGFQSEAKFGLTVGQQVSEIRSKESHNEKHIKAC